MTQLFDIFFPFLSPLVSSHVSVRVGRLLSDVPQGPGFLSGMVPWSLPLGHQVVPKPLVGDTCTHQDRVPYISCHFAGEAFPDLSL